MNVANFITELYRKIDDARPEVSQHSQAILSVGELATIGVLPAMKNVTQRPCYHWLKDNYGHRFPRLPKGSRLFRRLPAQPEWTGYFLAQPTVLGVADRYGIALCHPVREGRRPGQIGQQGQSHHRWIVGGKLAIVPNQWGLITDGDCNTAHVHDQTFPPLPAQYDGQMTVLANTGFHRAHGDPNNVKICRRGAWDVPMAVETTFAMMSVAWGRKEMRHRTGPGFETHLAGTMAAFNILVQWNGMEPDANGRIHRSIAPSTL